MSSNSTSTIEDVPWVHKLSQEFGIKRGMDPYLYTAYALLIVSIFLKYRYQTYHGIFYI